MADPDVPPIDSMAAADLKWMRRNGRVPRRLTIIVNLPEVPMGNETGVHTTHDLLFEDYVADPGKLGAVLRTLTKVEVDA